MNKNRIFVITTSSALFILILFVSLSAVAIDNAAYLKAQKNLEDGYQAYKGNNYQKAIKHLRISYKLMPDSKTAYYLSLSYYNSDDFSRARKFAKKTLADLPHLEGVYRKNAETIISWAEKSNLKPLESTEIISDATADMPYIKQNARRPKLESDPIETKLLQENQSPPEEEDDPISSKDGTALEDTGGVSTGSSLPPPSDIVVSNRDKRGTLVVTWQDNSTTEEGFYVDRLISDVSGLWETVATSRSKKQEDIEGTGSRRRTLRKQKDDATLCYRVRAYAGDEISDPSKIGCSR